MDNSPSKLRAVKASANLDFSEGLKKERDLFKICHDSKESSSLIHMFFSERQALKIPDISKDKNKYFKLILLFH